MVYCSRCGAKNEEGAVVCEKCGERLYASRPKEEVEREEACFGPREKREKHVEECFGVPRFGALLGVTVGLVIILFGVGWILSRYYNISIEMWPLAVVFFGLLILIVAISVFRRGR
jgi:ribosomal protein L40E